MNLDVKTFGFDNNYKNTYLLCCWKSRDYFLFKLQVIEVVLSIVINLFLFLFFFKENSLTGLLC